MRVQLGAAFGYGTRRQGMCTIPKCVHARDAHQREHCDNRSTHFDKAFSLQRVARLDDQPPPSLHLSPFVPLTTCSQVSTSFFSFSPLLSCLQQMTTVPLADELVHGFPSGPAGYLPQLQIDEVCKRKHNGFVSDGIKHANLHVQCLCISAGL